MSTETRELLSMEIKGLPPTVNMMYRGIHGHRFKTSDTVEYQSYVADRLREIWANKSIFAGRVEFSITYHTNSRRRWDIDNRVKALQDCLSLAGVIKDDSQVDKLIVERVFNSAISQDYTVLTLREHEAE